MTNDELYEQWLRRFAERTKKEALEKAEAEKKAREDEERRKSGKGAESQEGEESPSPIPASSFKDAFFLRRALGEEINKKIQNKYGKFEPINKIIYNPKTRLIEGSNPFYVVAVQEFLPEGIRVATQADLEKILKNNLLPLKNHYEDSGLVWRSNQEPNEYLAKDIKKQFKAKGIALKENSAYVFPLFSLRLRADEYSPYKLSFNITDETLKAYFEAPILNEATQQKFNNKDIDKSIGLPKKVGAEGNRVLYTRNLRQYPIKSSGLAWLCLGNALNLCSGSGDLADSSGSGRVVCVRAEGTNTRNFSSTGNRGL